MPIPQQQFPISGQLASEIQTTILNQLAGGPNNQPAIYSALAAFCQTQDNTDFGNNSPMNWPSVLESAFFPNGAGATLTLQGNGYVSTASTWQTLRYLAHWLVEPDTNNHCFKADTRADQFLAIINPGATPAQRQTQINDMLAAINASFPTGVPGDLVLSFSP